MPIIINGIVFNKIDPTLEQAITGLPEPSLIADSVHEPCLADTVLCLQREYLYITQENIAKGSYFIGSKNLNTCLLVYIKSSVDHLLIHWDATNEIDLGTLVQNFIDKKVLQVVLVGGNLGPHSKKILQNVLAKLLEASQALGIDIAITHQKLMGSNQFLVERDSPFLLYDKVIEKANIFMKRFLRKPLDMRHIKKLAISCFSDPMPADDQSALLIGSLLKNVSEIGLYNPPVKQNIEELWKLVNSEIKLYEGINQLLSPGGLKFLQQALCSLYPDEQMSDFVFDCRTGAMICIHRYASTPYEACRRMAVYDPTARYVSCFNTQANQYYPVSLSLDLIKVCDKLIAIVEMPLMSKVRLLQAMNQIMPDLDLYRSNHLIQFIKDDFRDAKRASMPLLPGAFLQGLSASAADGLASPSAIEIPVCHVCICGKEANRFRCGKCKKVYYCNPGCQMQDWPSHGPLCQAPKP